MSFTDKALTCSDCKTGFTFTASEQEFFASKGFVNEPGRCPACRTARKQQRGNGYGSRDGGNYRQQREMHAAVCASCGKNTQVPFEPRSGRPVYCSDCYSKSRR
ncbi:MAG: zinc-binding protein [Chloroflexi bacterium]|nr:zinc-binding protein [Chloroflexota bacterium]